MINLDIVIFYFFNNFVGVSNFLDSIFVFVAGSFSYVIIGSLCLIFLFFLDNKPGVFKIARYTWYKIIVISLSGVIAYVIAFIIKTITHVPRPFLALLDVNTLLVHGGYDSFPSGHASVFMALGIATYLLHKKLGFVYIIIALLVGISRIFVGVHFPIDVVVGFILGFMVAFSVVKLSAMYVKKQ